MLTSLARKFSLATHRQIVPKIRRHELASKSIKALFIRCFSEIKVDNESGNIEMHWSDGRHSDVPYEFLRDNCQCPSCFYEPATQSLTLLPDVLREAQQGIDTAELYQDEIVVQWKSGHLSKFKLDWLRKRVFAEPRPGTVGDLEHILWGSEHSANLKFFNFAKLMESDSYLLEWMKILTTEGISVLQGAARKPDQLRVLAKRAFGSLYNTMYGDIFTVKEKPGGNNLAYTSGYLALHTDQPYYNYQPGIQFLHCIIGCPKNQGVNQLVDGFKVATDLRDQNFEAFKVLSTLKFMFQQKGDDMFGKFILQNSTSPIGVNEFGEINRISHNYPSRAAYMNSPAKETKSLYQAAGIFQKMMYDPKYLMEYQLQEGDILCFNNQRILHGRTPYDPNASNRWLEGAYASWDDLLARMRAIDVELRGGNDQIN